MTLAYTSPLVQLHHGDCIEVMRSLPDASVHAVVTDPPYGISFMGKQWDQPGEFGSLRSIGTPGVHRRGRGRSDDQIGDTGAMDAGRYDLSPSAMRNFQHWCEAWAVECLRVLKPGGHLLAFGGSRTWHRLAAGIEDAGFEVRDSIAWLYGSGFPKSLDVAKAIDKARDDLDDILAVTTRLADLADAAGITRRQVDEVMGTSDMGGWWLSRIRGRAAIASVENWTRLREIVPGADELDDEVWRLNGRKGEWGNERPDRVVGEPGANAIYSPSQRVEVPGVPATDSAREWKGWGTALKPAFEPIVVARKPLSGTVAANVRAYGTGALNIDASRIHTSGSESLAYTTGRIAPGARQNTTGRRKTDDGTTFEGETKAGRWPSNVLLDESQANALDEQSGMLTSGILAAHHNRHPKRATGIYGDMDAAEGERGYGDSGGASRFFPTFRYEAKAPSDERPNVDGVQHPTVKPLDLMCWLVRLVTPPDGVVLEPFAGSGTTVEACLREGFACIAIEREADYLPLILSRIQKDHQQSLFGDWEGGDAA